VRGGVGAGWDGLRGGCGLEVCGCGVGSDTKFQPAQDSNTYCLQVYSCQLCCNYTWSSMKYIRVSYKHICRILHYFPRNVSFGQHQATYFVRTFDSLIRNNLYAFVQRCAFRYNFFIGSLQLFDVLCKSPFFSSFFLTTM